MSKSRDRRIREQKPLRGNIPPASFKDETSGISFSFKYLDVTNSKFQVADVDAVLYFPKLLERLKDLSGLTRTEICSNKSKALRSHQIDFGETTEPNGFPILDIELWADAYQLSISGNEYGRVHGFWIDNVFYIVWLDPKHKLFAKC